MSEGTVLKFYALLLVVPITCLIFMTFYVLALTEQTTIACIEQGYEWSDGSCLSPSRVLD